MSYAQAKSKGALSPIPSPARGRGEKGGLRELSEEEKERVACNKMRVELHLPEAVQRIRELYELGMIDGYRSVKIFRFEEEAQ